MKFTEDVEVSSYCQHLRSSDSVFPGAHSKQATLVRIFKLYSHQLLNLTLPKKDR